MKTKEATPPIKELVLPLAAPPEPTPAIVPSDEGDTVALMTVPSASGVPLRRVTVTVTVAVELALTDGEDKSTLTVSAGGGPNPEACACPPPATRSNGPNNIVRKRIGVFIVNSGIATAVLASGKMSLWNS